MEENQPAPTQTPLTRFIQSGQDWYGEQRGLTMSKIDFKVVPGGSSSVLTLENIFEGKGGPPRHLHYEQEEWFYALEGDFIFEVGQETFRLQTGDSLLAPRQVPHVWAHTGNHRGRILISFMPAGQMEAFFRKFMAGYSMPPNDGELWRAHGMELLGPPLKVA